MNTKHIIIIVGAIVVIGLLGIIGSSIYKKYTYITPSEFGTSTPITTKTEGILQGSVTVGPVCTKEIKEKYPTFSCLPTPEMYAAAHVLVYMPDKKTLVKTIIPDGQGKFSIALPEGEYFIDMIHQRMGGTKGVPTTVTIVHAKPVTLKLDVDTGLR